MALTVGELVAYIRADGTQFDSQMDASGRKFDGLKRTIDAGTKAFATAFATTTMTVGGLATSLVVTGANYNRLQQNSRAALATILGGTEAANKQMDKLDDFARNSPFAKQLFIQAQQQLLGFGVEAEKVLPTLDAIQNAVAATGGSGEQILALTDIFAKVQSSAKITGEDLNRFGTYGVDAAAMIGSQMGLTGEEIRSKITSGTLDAGQALDALTAGMQEKFGGATANIKNQFDGAADRIKGAWRDIGGIIAAPFIDPNGGGRAVEWANKVADALRALEQKARPLVDLLTTRFAPALNEITPLLDRVRGAINAWDLSKVNGQLDALSKYGPLIAPVAASLFALGSDSIPVLGRLLPALNPVVAGIGALVLTSPGLRRAGEDFIGALKPLIPIATTLGGVLASSLVSAIETLAPAIGDLLVAGANLAVTLGTGLAPAAVAVASALVPVATVVADVASWVAQLPTPVLAAVAAFLAFRNMNLTPVISGIASAFSAMSQTVGASRGVLEATGQSAGVMNTAMMTAKVGVGALGTALKTALISNPVGLALTALTTAFTLYSQAAANAKARSEAFADALSDTAASASETAEKVEDVVRKMAVTGENADWGVFQKWRTGYDSIADALEGVGSNLDSFSAAVSGSQSEFDAYIASLDDLKQSMKDAGTYTGEQGAAIEELKTKSHQMRNALADQRHVQDQLNGANKDAAGSTRDAAAASDEAAQAAKEHADALRETIDAQREASGAALSQKEAVLRVAEQQDRFNESLARYREVVADANASDADRDAAQRNMQSALYDTVRGYDTMLEAARKNNATGAELRDIAEQQYAAFVANAEASGLYGEEVEALARELGLLPEQVVTDVEIRTAEATAAVQGVGFAADGTRLSLSGMNAEQIAASDAGGVLAGQIAAAVTALYEQQAAGKAAGDSQEVLKGRFEATRNALIDQVAQTGIARGVAEQYIDTILDTPTQRNTAFTSNARVEIDTVRNLARTITTLPNGNVTIKATDLVTGEVNRILRANSGKTIYTTVAVGSQRVAAVQDMGGIVEMYANGGLRGLSPMAPIAQMVPPNTWRVVGDRAKDPEAYIPLDGSARSMAILDEAARRMGRVVMPLEHGAILGGQPRERGNITPGAVYNISIQGVDTNNADEVARKLVRSIRIRSRGGVYS